MKSLIVLISLFGSFALAEGKWIRLGNNVECTFTTNLSGRVGFYVQDKDYDKTVLFKTGDASDASFRSYVSKNIDICRAAVTQAKRDGKGIFLNIETGETDPELGFFTRIPVAK